jgi:quercetin dioxygenase-like cupin family protein
VDPHIHSFEESFYVLHGEAVFQLEHETWRVGAGDFGVARVGTLHAWRNVSNAEVRWLGMAAPQPKPPGTERDTFFAGRPDALDSGPDSPSSAIEHTMSGRRVSDAPPGTLLGHFDVSQIPPGLEGRTVSGGLQGVFLRWLIDSAFGAVHHRLLFIEYLPGVSIALHDHAFEEAYFVLSGQVQGTLDGRTYLAGPGDVLWTGVGCVHAFANVGNEPVRWLETFSPQPPSANVFRFSAEWEERGRTLQSRL